jgi:ParB family transcriptional regulator, chromosome partitioning protein
VETHLNGQPKKAVQTVMIRISDIRRDPDRSRKDYGNIPALAENIHVIGLIHPIGVDKDLNLIFGERRLRACDYLHWDKIEARIIDVNDPLLVELSENEFRKEFLLSELDSLRRRIKERIMSKTDQERDSYLRQMYAKDPEKLSKEQKSTDYLSAVQAGFDSKATAIKVSQVVDQADEATISAMDNGIVTVNQADTLRLLPKEEQRSVLEKGKKAIKDVVSSVRNSVGTKKKKSNEVSVKLDLDDNLKTATRLAQIYGADFQDFLDVCQRLADGFTD